MKYIITIILVVIMFGVDAQTSFRATTSNPLDSIIDTSVDTLSVTLSGSYGRVTIQPVVTRGSGTLAGKSYLYHSVNGTNYIVVDSVTLQNAASNTAIWNTESAARYWRITTGGSTTVRAKVAAKISAH